MAIRVAFCWLTLLSLYACVKDYPPPEPPITIVNTTCRIADAAVYDRD